MIDQFKLLGMTALLTGLIWVAADRLVTEEVSVPASFRISAIGPAGDTLLTPSAEVSLYQLRVVGPRKAVAALQTASPLSIRLQAPEPPAEFQSGQISLSLRDLLEEQWHEYRNINVIGVVPPRMSVHFDRVVTRDVPVVLQRLTLAYEVRPAPQPATVRVRMRASVLAEIAPNDQVPAIDISADAERLFREQSPGQAATVLVPVDPRPFGPDASVNPRAVEVRGTVTAQRTTAEIPTVPILLALSFANLGKPFRAVTRDGSELVTQTIKVTGPTEDVDRLVRGETRAFGIIQLKDSHFAELDVFKPLTPEFQLPPHIELAGKPAPIELKLTDPSRQPVEESGNGAP